MSYVRDAQTPKGAWENLKKVFAASTTARKLQLRQELRNLRQCDLSVADYTSKIKDICDSLAGVGKEGCNLGRRVHGDIDSFIDDYTRHTWIYLIERKSEVFDCFRDLKGFVDARSSAYGRMAEKGTFPVNSTVIYNKWEFGVSSVVDTRRSRTAWPRGRTGRLWKRHGQCWRRRACPSSTRPTRFELRCTSRTGT